MTAAVDERTMLGDGSEVGQHGLKEEERAAKPARIQEPIARGMNAVDDTILKRGGIDHQLEATFVVDFVLLNSNRRK